MKSKRFKDVTGRDMRLLLADPLSLSCRERLIIGATSTLSSFDPNDMSSSIFNIDL